MNKYQRIIRNNKEVQPGSIDTHKKFKEITQGVSLKGKSIVDIGCNLGEMCRLAKENKAKFVFGIDRTMEFIHDARELNPDIKFIVGTERQLFGKYDIAIASAMFHYVKDQDFFFRRIAQCCDTLLIDVWLSDREDDSFIKSKRGLYIPSRKTFLGIASKYFNKIEDKGQCISPDNSKRFIFHLSEPKRNKNKAILIYGESNTGKTTLSLEYENLGYHKLSLDRVFMAFYCKNNKLSIPYSVRGFVDNIPDNLINTYFEFHENYINKWLRDKVGHDIVIEGYDMIKENYRDMIKKLIKGWSIEEIYLTKKWK